MENDFSCFHREIFNTVNIYRNHLHLTCHINHDVLSEIKGSLELHDDKHLSCILVVTKQVNWKMICIVILNIVFMDDNRVQNC